MWRLLAIKHFDRKCGRSLWGHRTLRCVCLGVQMFGIIREWRNEWSCHPTCKVLLCRDEVASRRILAVVLRSNSIIVCSRYTIRTCRIDIYSKWIFLKFSIKFWAKNEAHALCKMRPKYYHKIWKLSDGSNERLSREEFGGTMPGWHDKPFQNGERSKFGGDWLW